MFDLNDKTIEEIIFAMEDQEGAMVVDLEMGAVIPRNVLESEEDAESFDEGDIPVEERYVEPPKWSSREGFKLMEDFLALVRLPTARRELQAALSRGRGVFKTFKAVLAAYPEIERAFRDYKVRVMRRPIAEWYDDQREALGLARLGPEPEETEDLVSSEFEIRVTPIAEERGELLTLIREAADEALATLPAPIAAFEAERLEAELEGGNEGFVALADDGEGGVLGVALAFRAFADERSFGRIRFIGIREDFRRIGLGAALLDAIAERFSSEGVSLLAIDSVFLPPEYGERLEARGYAAYGTRAAARIE